jgi:hypothetical protein
VREAQAAGIIRVGWIPGESGRFTYKDKLAGNMKNDIMQSIVCNQASGIDDELVPK